MKIKKCINCGFYKFKIQFYHDKNGKRLRQCKTCRNFLREQRRTLRGKGNEPIRKDRINEVN